jgi:hypothetical protein
LLATANATSSLLSGTAAIAATNSNTTEHSAGALRNSHSAGGLLTGNRKPGALSDGFDSDPLLLDPIRDLQLEALAASVSMLPPVSDLLTCSYEFTAAGATATAAAATAGTNSTAGNHGTTVNRSKQVWGSKAQLATILPGTNPLSPAKLPLAARSKGVNSSSSDTETAAAAGSDDGSGVAALNDVDVDNVSTNCCYCM